MDSYSVKNSLARLRNPVEQVLIVVLGLGSLFLMPRMGQGEVFPRPTQEYFDAQELLSKRRWDEAALLLRRVLNTSPQFTPAALSLAKALTFSKRREEAVGVLNQVISQQRGASREKLIQQLRVISRQFLTQETFRVHQEGLNLIREKKYKLASEKFLQGLEQEPDNLEILIRLGQCLVFEEDFDSAAERLRFAKKLNPFEPEIRLWLGRALHQRGELKAALQEFQSAVRDLPGSELAPLWFSEALVSSGQRKAALQMLEADVQVHPFHLKVLFSLVQMRYFSVGRDLSTLWAIRKDLQVALSRLDTYVPSKTPKFEGELGIDLRDLPTVQADIHALLARVSSRLEGSVE